MNQLVFSPHPLLPQADRQSYVFKVEDGTTIADILGDKLGDQLHNKPVVLFLDDKPIAQEDWDKTVTHLGQNIYVRATVQGGGGDGGSNPTATILTIALIAFAPYAGAALYGAGTFGAAVVQGAILVGGSLIINALFPPQLPVTPPSASTGENVSPTYSITGGGNSGRPYSPIPVVVGKCKMYPDLAAKPYTEFIGEDQYLNELFCWGAQYTRAIDDVKIGNTLLSSYDDVTTEYSSELDGEIDLFPANVDTDVGPGELEPQGSWNTYTSPLNTTALVVDMTTVLFAYTKEGVKKSATATVEIQYREVGSGTWLAFTDINSPNSWFEISGDTSKPERHSYRKDVAEGQYEIRVRNLSPADDPLMNVNIDVYIAGVHVQDTGQVAYATYNNNVYLNQVKYFQKDTGTYDLQKRSALRVRASGQLNGVIQQLNGIVTAKASKWNGSAWVETATEAEDQNPAWIFARLAFGRYFTDGRLAWGLGRSESEIDEDVLADWAAWCDTHSLKCNYVFDRSISGQEMLAVVARTGRASISYATGKLAVVWDEENLPVSQVFGMGNIIQDTFNINYISENLADQIVVRFVNQDLDWQPDTVRATVPGVTTPIRPVTIDLAGVTTESQAGKEANLLAARQYYMKKRVSFETDVEGLVCGRGDVISISHDLVNWGVSGRLKEGSTDSLLKFYRSITMENGQPNYIAVRAPDGTYEVTQCDYVAGEVYEATLSTPLSFDPSTDTDNPAIDYLWFFDPEATPGKKFKIVEMVPLSEGSRVQIIAIDEEADYYTSESNSYDYTVPTLLNTGVATVSNVSVTEDYIDIQNTSTIHVTWDLDQAVGARLRVQLRDGSVVDYGNINGTSYSFVVYQTGTIHIELTPIALYDTKDAPLTTSVDYTVVGNSNTNLPIYVMSPPTGLELFQQGNNQEFTGKDAKFVWRQTASVTDEFGNELLGGDSGNLDNYFKDYEVRIYNEDGTTLRRIDHVINEEYIYTHEKNYEDGIDLGETHATRTFRIEVYTRGKLNNISKFPAKLLVSNPAPDVPTNINVKSTFRAFWIDYDRPTDLDFIGCKVWVSTTPGFTPSASNLVIKEVGTSINIGNLDPGTEYYFRLAPYDAFGDDEINTSSEYNTTTLQVETADYADLSIVNAVIADGAIDNAKIQDATITDAKILDLSADKITAGTIEGLIMSSGVFYSTGSHVTTEWTTGSTLDINDEADFGSSGTAFVYPGIYPYHIQTITYTGTSAGQLTGVSGLSGTIPVNSVVVPGNFEDVSVVISTDANRLSIVGSPNSAASNGQVIADFNGGEFTAGPILTIGYDNSLTQRIGAYFVSGVNTALEAKSYTGYGVYGIGDSTNAVGVYGQANGVGTGVSGYAAGSGGYAAGFGFNEAGGAKGPLYLQPSTSSSAPTHSAAEGTVWIAANGTMYINSDGASSWSQMLGSDSDYSTDYWTSPGASQSYVLPKGFYQIYSTSASLYLQHFINGGWRQQLITNIGAFIFSNGTTTRLWATTGSVTAYWNKFY